MVLHVSTYGDPQAERRGRARAVRLPAPAGASADPMAWLEALAGLAPDVAGAAGFEEALRILAEGLATVAGVDAVAVLEPGPAADALRLVHDALEVVARRTRETMLRDPVTGLPSQAAWSDALPRLLATARREGVPLSVAVLDLDHFQAVNEVQGRDRGDLLLRQAAAAWSAAVREGDYLCRHGGDGIAVVLVGCDLDTAISRAERLCAAIPSGYSCSGGVACWDGAEDSAALTDRARTALVDAKVAGRSRVAAAADAALESGAASGWTRWAALLPEILAGRRIHSVYQPVVGMVSGRVAAYEALARPSGGAPDMDVEGLFAAAQYRGQLRDLDWLCRRAAVAGARALDPRLPLFVNVAVSALLDPLLDVEHMLLLLRWAGRAPENTVLEITEREAVRDLDRFAEVLASYRAHGFRFAIDDVGEGHSTLQVLATAMPEFVKVARSLVAAAPGSGREAALRAVIAFAASTGAVVVAEGIETDEEARRMRDLGIALGQGTRLGPPVVLPAA